MSDERLPPLAPSTEPGVAPAGPAWPAWLGGIVLLAYGIYLRCVDLDPPSLWLDDVWVAVLARGYGAARDGELNDELRQVQDEVPDALLFPGRDRVARARLATDAGATLLLLDDGFQHRRLARDVDVVILDATEPWGAPAGKLLPRGLLREPPLALRRADVVVFSRVELVGRAELGQLEGQVARHGFLGTVARRSPKSTQNWTQPRLLRLRCVSVENNSQKVFDKA